MPGVCVIAVLGCCIEMNIIFTLTTFRAHTINCVEFLIHNCLESRPVGEALLPFSMSLNLHCLSKQSVHDQQTGESRKFVVVSIKTQRPKN